MSMQNLSKIFLLWKLAILRLCIYCFTVAGGMYLASMHSQKWSQLDGEDRFDLLLGIAMAVGGVVISFLDNSIKNISSGDELPPGVTEPAPSPTSPTILTQNETKNPTNP